MLDHSGKHFQEAAFINPFLFSAVLSGLSLIHVANLVQLLTSNQPPQMTDHFLGVKVICPAHGKHTDLESVTVGYHA